MSQHIYIAHLSYIKHLWHSSVYVCTLSHATPITTDQAIIIPNALVFIVIISSLFLWGTPAPIVEVIAKLNE